MSCSEISYKHVNRNCSKAESLSGNWTDAGQGNTDWTAITLPHCAIMARNRLSWKKCINPVFIVYIWRPKNYV